MANSMNFGKCALIGFALGFRVVSVSYCNVYG